MTDTLTYKNKYMGNASNLAIIGEERVKRAIIDNATAAFALIDNLEAIRFYFAGESYEIVSRI
ncbi:MAG: hypothetical protein WDZ91_00400 [Paenibacillaceae bacterium]